MGAGKGWRFGLLGGSMVMANLPSILRMMARSSQSLARLVHRKVSADFMKVEMLIRGRP